MKQKNQLLQQKPIPSFSTNPAARDAYLMKMPAKDYFLNYHSIIQYGDRESSLKQRPVLKLGQQAGRDETSYMKDILMTIRKKEEAKAERMEQQAMRFVKKQI